MVQDSKNWIIVSPQAYICCALMLMTIPIRWYGSWIIAAFCHECFHCIAVRLTGKKIRSICIGAFGAKIYTDPLKPAESVFCSLSGPLAGFLLLLFTKYVPYIAICALVQSVCNLLPIAPLDGSITLSGFLRLLFSEQTSKKICTFLEKLIFAVLLLLCLYAACIWKLGKLPLIFAAIVLTRSLKRKIPCKYGLYRVQ